MTGQNLTFSTPYALSIRRNFTHFIFFKSYSDTQILSTFGKSVNPKDSKFLIKCMEKICSLTQVPWERHLLIDCSYTSLLPDELRVRGNILGSDPWFLMMAE